MVGNSGSGTATGYRPAKQLVPIADVSDAVARPGALISVVNVRLRSYPNFMATIRLIL